MAIGFFEHCCLQVLGRKGCAKLNAYVSEFFLAANVRVPYAGVGACERVLGFYIFNIVSSPRKCTSSVFAACPRLDAVLELLRQFLQVRLRAYLKTLALKIYLSEVSAASIVDIVESCLYDAGCECADHNHCLHFCLN